MNYTPDIFSIWTYFGLVSLGVYLVPVVVSLWYLIKRYVINSPVDWSKYRGKWGLITGCTDGIGRAMAYELAKYGINLVLISRTESKLRAIETELKEKYRIETQVVVVDFMHDDEQEYIKRIEAAIKNIRIDLLFNIVGTSPLMLDYEVFEGPKTRTYLKCVLGSLNNVTGIVLPKMVERRHGVVVNMGSLLSFGALPLMGCYSGTRAYIKNFSESLHELYKDQGITITMLAPGLVATKIGGVTMESFDFPAIPSPERYAVNALGQIGTSLITTGYWLFELEYIVELLYGAFLSQESSDKMSYNRTYSFFKFFKDNGYDYNNFDYEKFNEKTLHEALSEGFGGKYLEDE